MIALLEPRALLAVGCVLVLLPVAFVLWLKYINWRGSKTTVEALGDFMEFVLKHGCDQSRLRFRRPGTKYRIEFEKSVPPPSGRAARFRMMLDSRRCSRVEFEAVQLALRRCQIAFEVWDDLLAQRQCVFVECGPDPMLATRAAKAVFVDAFGFKPETTLQVCHSGEFEIDMGRDTMIGWEPWRESRRGIAPKREDEHRSS